MHSHDPAQPELHLIIHALILTPSVLFLLLALLAATNGPAQSELHFIIHVFMPVPRMLLQLLQNLGCLPGITVMQRCCGEL